MKIRVVSSKDEIAQLNPREKVVHLVAPPTFLTFLEMINRCPRLEAIEVHPARFERLSEPSSCLLEVQSVKIFPGIIQGHRTDMSEYLTVDEGPIPDASLLGIISDTLPGLPSPDVWARSVTAADSISSARNVNVFDLVEYPSCQILHPLYRKSSERDVYILPLCKVGEILHKR